MNKKEFLKELEKRLSILEDTERKDIINEYKDTIEEKMKHGETEEDAIRDFGSMDELVREILKAYKINPEFQKKDSEFKESAKEVGRNLDAMIKKGAKSMADYTNKLADDMKENGRELTVEFIFELLLKALLLLVLLALLAIPFQIIKYLGIGILDVFFTPLDMIGIFLWKIIIYVLYFVTCIIITITMFRKYVPFGNESVSPSSKREEKGTKKVKKEIIEDYSVTGTKEEKEASRGNHWFSIFLKIIGVLFIIPCVCANVGLVCAIVVIIYLIIKGVPLFGVLILICGLSWLFAYFQDSIYRLTFRHKRIFFFPLFGSMILIVFGGLWSMEQLFHMDYYARLPEGDFQSKTVLVERIIQNPLLVEGNVEIIKKLDSSLSDQQVKIEIRYYEDFISMDYTLETRNCGVTLCDVLDVDRYFSQAKKPFRLIRDSVISNLKENKIYSYRDLRKIFVTISANETTMKSVSFENF